MAVQESFHSSVVAWLKVLLPLTALGLLSTVFLLSRSVADDPALTFFDDEAEIPARDSLIAPYYTGSTPEGHAVAITAKSARADPNDPAGVLASQLTAAFRLTDGSQIDIVANTAAVNEPADLLELAGDVVIKSSAGYVVHTQMLTSALRTIRGEAPNGVKADGPIGDLQAGAFHIRETGTEDNLQLVFTNGVKLLYQPAKHPPEEESERP